MQPWGPNEERGGISPGTSSCFAIAKRLLLPLPLPLAAATAAAGDNFDGNREKARQSVAEDLSLDV